MRGLSTAALSLFLSIAGAACGPDIDLDPLGCALGEMSHNLDTMFEQARASDLDRAEMTGLCSAFRRCDDRAPLVAGGEYAVSVVLHEHDPATSMALISSDGAVLEVPSQESSCGVGAGTLVARSVGHASLALVTLGSDGWQEVDRFTLESAAASSLEVFDPAVDEDREHHVGSTFELVAVARDATSRTLAIGYNTEWTLADDGVLAPAGSTANLGAGTFLTAEAPGTTTVSVRLGELEAEIAVEVLP